MFVDFPNVPLERAVPEPVGRGALGADGGAPDLVEGADALSGGEVGSADAGFEGVEVRATALQRDAVKRWQGAYAAECGRVFLG